MPRSQGELESFLTLVLADQAPELAAAHDELYPVRVGEAIPLSLTLLYPFIPSASLTETDLAGLTELFATRQQFAFSLTHLAAFSRGGMYAVPQPDGELRELMRAVWRRFPDYPPYGKQSGDPMPHATLAQSGPDPASVRAAVTRRVSGLLPKRFETREVTLMEEHAPDKWRTRATFSLAN